MLTVEFRIEQSQSPVFADKKSFYCARSHCNDSTSSKLRWRYHCREACPPPLLRVMWTPSGTCTCIVPGACRQDCCDECRDRILTRIVSSLWFLSLVTLFAICGVSADILAQFNRFLSALSTSVTCNVAGFSLKRVTWMQPLCCGGKQGPHFRNCCTSSIAAPEKWKCVLGWNTVFGSKAMYFFVRILLHFGLLFTF